MSEDGRLDAGLTDGVTARRLRVFSATLGAYVLCAWGGVIFLAYKIGELQSHPSDSVEEGDLAEGEVVWDRDPQYVLDDVVGHRARANHTQEFFFVSVDGSESHHCRRHQNNLGLIRLDDVGDELSEPRLLLVGDSHLTGIVSNEQNAASLLEYGLRNHAGMTGAQVLNASAGYYSLYQYVLRLRTLADRLQPQALVVTVFMGNDFLELEDVSRPHLDDEGVEQRPSTHPPPERTSRRLRSLSLANDHFFWQGLNQAVYLMENPDRIPFLERKARAAVRLLKELASQRGCALEFALIPSYDVVFPDLLVEREPGTEEVVRSGAQRTWYDWFRGLLEDAEVGYVDLLPSYQEDGQESLYAEDLHIFLRGHLLLATELFERMPKALEAASSE